MTEWAYRATKTKVGFTETIELADKEHFLCRSAFNRDGNFIANVKEVRFGHIIHMYYSDPPNGLHAIGSFEVIDDDSKRFAGAVKHTALQIVTNAVLEQQLASLGTEDATNEGYKPDPLIRRYTGWLLKRHSELQPPSFAFPKDFAGSLHKIQ